MAAGLAGWAGGSGPRREPGARPAAAGRPCSARELRLAGNGLAELHPLSGLEGLQDLGLGGNAVEDLHALSAAGAAIHWTAGRASVIVVVGGLIGAGMFFAAWVRLRRNRGAAQPPSH